MFHVKRRSACLPGVPMDREECHRRRHQTRGGDDVETSDHSPGEGFVRHRGRLVDPTSSLRGPSEWRRGC